MLSPVTVTERSAVLPATAELVGLALHGDPAHLYVLDARAGLYELMVDGARLVLDLPASRVPGGTGDGSPPAEVTDIAFATQITGIASRPGGTWSCSTAQASVCSSSMVWRSTPPSPRRFETLASHTAPQDTERPQSRWALSPEARRVAPNDTRRVCSAVALRRTSFVAVLWVGLGAACAS